MIRNTYLARALFPWVAALDRDAEVVISGISCRQQVQHGTGKTPRHPADVLAEALE